MNNFTPLKNVRINSPFWKTYTDIAKDKIIPYQWQAINDQIPDTAPSHAIQNFRIAAGLEEGEFGGMVFQDSDVAKWLEAVAYRLTIDPDPELEKTADDVIDLIGKAQEEDGYLNTYFQIKEPDKKFTNLLDCHELYCAGHMTEAAVAYYEATGKEKLLKIMCRYIDLIDTKIGPEEGKIKGYPGHPEIELALVKLYRATGEKRYLKLCEFMVNERGTDPNYFDQELEARNHIGFWGGGYQRGVDKKYCQAHKPIRQQTEAVGHSVRAGYLYTGCADLAAETGDDTLKRAMEVIWDNITEKQMYITGGVGSQVYGEAYSFNYHLPNDTVYAETCAQISMVFFAQKMLRLSVDRKYSDVMERLIYNGTISGMALDGRHFFYTNPLSVWEEETKKFAAVRHNLSKRPGWFGCACCPPNLARMITSLGNYIYSSDEDTVYTHLYIGGDADIPVGDKTVHVTQTGNYPWSGEIGFTLSGGKYTFALRIPGWARSFELKINGSRISPEIRRGYAYITREWSDGDTVELTLPMPVELIEANPLAREDAGKAAIMRGPVVYCLEAADNGDVLTSVRLTGEFETYEDDTLFEGAVNIRASAMRRKGWTDSILYRPLKAGDEEPCTVTAIPYAFWTNRADTREMIVWVRI
ncbi:MAG: glycoside hydrolase family 127 protein [Clostridia bacterium]|nr:glycoside hydrolase family 127 protein [Clostridia bacterium]